MFDKIFIFILLVTNVVSDKPNIVQKENIDSWWKDIQETFQEYYEQSKKTFEETLNEVKRRTLNAIETSKEKFSELKKRYDNIQENIKSDKEDKRIWEARLQDLKDQSMEIMKTINEKYNQLKQKSQNIINKQQEIWQTKLKELLKGGVSDIDDKKSEKK